MVYAKGKLLTRISEKEHESSSSESEKSTISWNKFSFRVSYRLRF